MQVWPGSTEPNIDVLGLLTAAAIRNSDVPERIFYVLAATCPGRLGTAVAGDLLAHVVTPLEDF
jgi:hypothetical protein